MKNEMISILMPMYNAETYIKQAIESIINQTYNNWELIIINDGSTDKSKDICEKYSTIDCRIKIINKENSGVSDSRNVGLKYANGKYVGFVDCDDIISEVLFEELVKAIETNNCEMAVCGFNEIKSIDNIKGEEINTKIYYSNKYINVKSMKNNIIDFHRSQTLHPLWNKLYKVDVIKNNNIKFCNKLKTGEDFIFNLDYIKSIKKICFVNKSLYNYYKRNNKSITRGYMEDMYEQGKLIHSHYKEFLISMDFYNNESKYILSGNHLIGIYAAFLNLFHKDCPMSLKEKKQYINDIITDKYVKECANNRKNDKGIVGIISFLVRLNKIQPIVCIFYLLSIARRIKS